MIIGQNKSPKMFAQLNSLNHNSGDHLPKHIDKERQLKKRKSTVQTLERYDKGLVGESGHFALLSEDTQSAKFESSALKQHLSVTGVGAKPLNSGSHNNLGQQLKKPMTASLSTRRKNPNQLLLQTKADLGDTRND